MNLRVVDMNRNYHYTTCISDTVSIHDFSFLFRFSSPIINWSITFAVTPSPLKMLYKTVSGHNG